MTIAIKALNERQHIADTLSHALEAARPLDAEVLLADSGSVDGTIDIARRFPVRIVQLANPDERCCGAGAQLAFQSSRGHYFYLLDGDMLLDPGFLPAAIDYLERHPDVAGVGGELRERIVSNQEFLIRARAGAKLRPAGEKVDNLDGGGLYRRSAIEQVGYFADRNLRAFEELDLGWRLRVAGWTLARISVHSVDHFGHDMSGYRLLWRRLRSGYAGGAGQLLRAAWGKPHFRRLASSFSHGRNSLVVILWWVLLIATCLSGHGWPFAILLLAAPLLFLTVRRRSLSLALYNFLSWNSIAWATIGGILRPRIPPERPLDIVVIADDAVASDAHREGR
ncbi:glycosyltransferase [Sphingobium aromaticiconvertens]|uniref:glycosyltransferase n=1 Tax=Sphingobium aromaticiconvertens TaxID=365341 RepID=UPI00301B3102